MAPGLAAGQLTGVEKSDETLTRDLQHVCRLLCGEHAGVGKHGCRVAGGDAGCDPFEHQHEAWRERVSPAAWTDQIEATADVRCRLECVNECAR